VGTEDGLRRTLVAAALEILEVEGAEPSLRAVARAAGVSAMAPYRHFADKAALLAAVASRGFETLRDALAEADDQPDADQALYAQGVAFVAFARRHPALFRLMYGPQYGNADLAAVAATAEILARRVAVVAPANAAAAALACRAMAQGVAAIELNGRLGPAGPDDIAAALRLLVSGLRAV
jgi:AcrR family transcriptional regulator